MSDQAAMGTGHKEDDGQTEWYLGSDESAGQVTDMFRNV